MFVISDLTVTGPFWFNFIPWLYILGTIGSLKKIDSVLMCIIGAFTVFIASLIMGGGLTLDAVLSTVIALINLVFGIFTGKLLYEFVLEHRLVKYIKRSRKTIYIISSILMFALSFTFVALTKGNIVAYLMSKSNLKEYIQETYNIQEFDIVSTKHNRQVAGKYVYVVELDGQEVYFVPISNEIFKDVNKAQRLEMLNLKLQQETSENINSIAGKYEAIKNAQIGYALEYTKHGVKPDTITLNVVCDGNYEDMNLIYEELSKCIKEMMTYKQADNVVITINKQSLKITKVNIQNITPEYIKGGFQIEVISD